MKFCRLKYIFCLKIITLNKRLYELYKVETNSSEIFIQYVIIFMLLKCRMANSTFFSRFMLSQSTYIITKKKSDEKGYTALLPVLLYFVVSSVYHFFIYISFCILHFVYHSLLLQHNFYPIFLLHHLLCSSTPTH